MKPVATIILNRNLPKVTDKLYSRIKKHEGYMTDIFIVEAGSLKKIYQNMLHGMQIQKSKTRRLKISKGYELWFVSDVERKNIYKI